MKGNVALFCIILIVISSVLEIKALMAQPNGRRRSTQKNRRVSESPRQTFYPQKVTVHVTINCSGCEKNGRVSESYKNKHFTHKKLQVINLIGAIQGP